MRRNLVIALAVFGLAAAGCAGSSDENITIEEFDVSEQADCSDGETGTVDVSWTTDGATEVAHSVDGEEVLSGADTEGSTSLTVQCDGEDHEVEMEAADDDGNTKSQTETVSTETATSGSGGGSDGSGSTSTTSSPTTTTLPGPDGSLLPTTTTGPPPVTQTTGGPPPITTG